MSSLYSWLPAVLPADATRIRVVGDAELVAILDTAGADTSAAVPDVEISNSLAGPVGDAAMVALDLGDSQPDGGARLRRAMRRVRAHRGVRRAAVDAERILRAAGYVHVTVIPWDYEQNIQLPGLAHAPGRLAERLPERAIVAASRDTPRPTLLDRIVREAAGVTGDASPVTRLLVRAGVIVALRERSVVRVAVGPAQDRLHAQRHVLEQLADAPPVVTTRLPLPVHTGVTGLASWSAEARVPGDEVAGEPSAQFVADCADFLVALHAVGDRAPARSPAADARTCSAVCESERDRADLLALGERVARNLEGVPHGFAHGDFWLQNLLSDGSRLTGVYDWDGGGPGRLPLLDLIHLRVSGVRQGARMSLVSALLRSELETARAGGDAVTRLYCERIGMDPAPRVLESLVHAFWIERAALELELRPDVVSPAWVDENIGMVLTRLRRDRALV